MTSKDDFDSDEAGAFSAVNTIMGALERQREALSERRPALIIGAAGLMVVALIGIIWISYPKGGEVADEPVPTIHADATPIKTVPDDREGMDIPHRDSTVFDTIRANPEQQAKTENLLDDTESEQPIERAETFAATGEADETAPPQPVAAVTEDGSAKTEITEEKSKAAETVTAEKEAPQPEPVKIVEKPAEKIVKTEPASGTEEPKAKASTGSYFIQLSSVQSSDAAKTEWAKLKKQFPAQLGDLTLRIKTADLGAKGTFYRVQAGSLSESKAKSVCDAIKAKRAGGCLVVRP